MAAPRGGRLPPPSAATLAASCRRQISGGGKTIRCRFRFRPFPAPPVANRQSAIAAAYESAFRGLTALDNYLNENRAACIFSDSGPISNRRRQDSPAPQYNAGVASQLDLLTAEEKQLDTENDAVPLRSRGHAESRATLSRTGERLDERSSLNSIEPLRRETLMGKPLLDIYPLFMDGDVFASPNGALPPVIYSGWRYHRHHQTTTAVKKKEDNLYDIARRFDIGIVELLVANPGIDAWMPVEGTWLTITTGAYTTQHPFVRALL